MRKRSYGAESLQGGLCGGHDRERFALAGRDSEAVARIQAANPSLAIGHETRAAADDKLGVELRAHQIQATVERYMGLLARKQVETASMPSRDIPSRRSIRVVPCSKPSALRAHGSRQRIGGAALVRKEQDTGKQIGAQLGFLNNC